MINRTSLALLALLPVIGALFTVAWLFAFVGGF